MKYHCLLKIIRRLRRYACYCISVPSTAIILLLYPLIKIRLISLFSDRIGHYALNTELMLCELENDKNNKKITRFYYTAEAPICNEQLHLMWKRTIPIIPYPLLAFQVDQLLSFILGKNYSADPAKRFGQGMASQDKQGLLARYAPHLSFTTPEKEMGEALIRRLGLPKNKPFVCLLVRDSAYLNDFFSEMDWGYHNYRDANISYYKKAALYLTEQGFYVLRMGKCVASKFDVKHPMIIDYANHELRSDFLDIYMPSRCEFFISTSSGLDAIAQVFRRPIVFTNVAPINGQLQYWFPSILFITKKIKHTYTNKLLTFQEIKQLTFKHDDLLINLDRLGLELLENTEDEIVDVIQEMVDLFHHNWVEPYKSKQLRLQFNASFPTTLIHDIGHVESEQVKTKIGEAFQVDMN